MGNAHGLESQRSPTSCVAAIAVVVIPAQDQDGGEGQLDDDEASAKREAVMVRILLRTEVRLGNAPQTSAVSTR